MPVWPVWFFGLGLTAYRRYSSWIEARKSDGATPLDLARRNNHRLTAELLAKAVNEPVKMDEPVSLKLLCAIAIRRNLGTRRKQ